MPEQFSFDLIRRPALGRDDFFVTPANATALAQVEAWRDWPSHKLALIGPQASGKTHLTHVWAAQAEARIVAADTLATADIPALAQAPLALEDAAVVAGNDAAEEALFHLYNLTQAQGVPLLLTAVAPPAQWPTRLPDLASRLGSIATAALAPPDDTLLAAVLMKQLFERQLECDPDLITYAVTRMERRLGAARQLAIVLNQEVFARRKAITRQMLRAALDKLRRDPP